MPVFDITIEFTDLARVDFHFPNFRQRGETTMTSLVLVTGDGAMQVLDQSVLISSYQQSWFAYVLDIMNKRLAERLVDDPPFWRIFFERIDLGFESGHVFLQTAC